MDNFSAMFSVEAEQNVLGSLMFSETAWDEVCDLIAVADFVRHDHRMIFSAIEKLAADSKPRDAVTVSEKLIEFGEAEQAGGVKYLGELLKNTASSSNVKAYAEIVRDRAQLRRLTQAFKAGEADIENPELTLPEKVAMVTERLEGAMASLSTADGAKTAREAGRSWIDWLNDTFNAGSVITGVRTGFPSLDKAIRGLNKKHLLVLAARPSMGKTTLAVNFARNILKDGGSVFLATMEMSSDDVMNQMCAAHTGCSYEAIQEARLGDEAVAAATGAFASALRDWRLAIDDRGTQTVASIRRGVKRHMRLHGPCVVIVDYAQLIDEKSDNEVTRVGLISRGMKKIAQDFNIPVVLLSQLSRKCEERTDKRPLLSDLRGSGDIEQDASEVIFLYNDSVYNPNNAQGFTELIIAKNRHGKRGMVLPLLNQLDRARFVTPDTRDMQENWRGLPEPKEQSRRGAL